MGSYDLQVESLRKVNFVLADKPNYASNLMLRFPFHQLAEVLPLNVEVISQLCALFTEFVKHDEVQEHLPTIMRFYSQIIAFHINSDDCDFEILVKVLTELLGAMRRAVALGVKCECALLMKTLHAVAHHPTVMNVELRLAAITFAYYIDCCPVKEEHFEELCAGIWKVTHRSDNEVRLTLARALLCNIPSDDLTNYQDVIRYLIKMIKIVTKCKEAMTKQILVCVKDIYAKCTAKTIRLRISVALAETNFPKNLAQFFLTDDNLKLMHELFYHQISVLFENTPWNSTKERSLLAIIRNLDKPFLMNTVPEDGRTDFDLIVHFFEVVYTDVKCDKKQLLTFILKLYAQKLPTNPAVLKSVYLLFAACVGLELTTAEWKFQNELLLSLQHSDDLEHYLTYHIAQILWVIKYGSRILKWRVVTMWIKQKDEAVLGVLLKCLKETEQQKIMLDVVCNEDDVLIKDHAVQLFLLGTPNSRAILTHLLLRQNLTVNTLDCIMRGSPQEMTLCKAENPQFKNVLGIIRAIVHRLINIITDEKIGILECTRHKILVHLHNTCWQLSRTEYAECFVIGKLVKVVIAATKSSSPKDACNAYQFLLLIANTQVHMKIALAENIIIEPVPLHEDSKLILCAVRLFQYILNPAYGEHRLISVQGRQLGLYHNMMEVLTFKDGIVGDAVYNLVVTLLETYEECVASLINISAIRLHCRNLNVNVYFVKYLTIWCQQALKHKYVRIPVRNIVPFVRRLDSIQYKDADYAVLRQITVGTEE